MPIEPFTLDVDDAELADLHTRIRNTRWPPGAPGPAWSQGTDLAYLKSLLGYWADGFDWRAQERELNRLHHYRTRLDDVQIHFVHEKARSAKGIPLILSHGWPSCFIEWLPMVPLLTDPAAHGIDGPAFDLVIPSLPGYGYSERPERTGVNYRSVAGLWQRLMRELGYERYGAGGGDWGAGVASLLALDRPDAVIGLYLTTFELDPYRGPDAAPLSAAERAYLTIRDGWDARERGYSAIQSTKPQTAGYGLTDSPAGLAAWILEKWRSWSDSGGDLDAHLSRDFLLTLLTIYWTTGSITTSMRDYYDNRWSKVEFGLDDRVSTPTGYGVFTRHFVDEGEPPREWAARLYNIQRWTPMPRGGHFAAAEEPELVAQDIAAFFGALE
ncbi:MAG TPA: epoxide hydrolase [Jatrophihabitantaceae bacterium]|jgi:pimeloyl-ACP methyl ester carboxylesterase